MAYYSTSAESACHSSARFTQSVEMWYAETGRMEQSMGTLVREARQAQQLSQRALAKQMGCRRAGSLTWRPARSRGLNRPSCVC